MNAAARVHYRIERGRSLASRRDAEPPGQAWFRTVTDRQLERAYRLACFVLGSTSDAEDATQDALALAWSSRRQLRDVGRAQAWFDQILLNVCRQRLRGQRRVEWLDVDGLDVGSQVDDFARAIARDVVLRAVADLDVDHRSVIVLRYWADLSIDAIAERVSVPVGTVKSRLHYGLRTLRLSLESTLGPTDE